MLIADNHVAHTNVEVLRVMSTYGFKLAPIPVYSPIMNLPAEWSFAFGKRFLQKWLGNLDVQSMQQLTLDELKAGIVTAFNKIDSRAAARLYSAGRGHLLQYTQ